MVAALTPTSPRSLPHLRIRSSSDSLPDRRVRLNDEPADQGPQTAGRTSVELVTPTTRQSQHHIHRA
jgi:hypothetical protein